MLSCLQPLVFIRKAQSGLLNLSSAFIYTQTHLTALKAVLHVLRDKPCRQKPVWAADVEVSRAIPDRVLAKRASPEQPCRDQPAPLSQNHDPAEDAHIGLWANKKLRKASFKTYCQMKLVTRTETISLLSIRLIKTRGAG